MMNEPFFSGVKKSTLAQTLPFVEHLLQDAVKTMNGRMDYEDLLDFLQRGQYQLWVAGQGAKIQACLVSEIVVYCKRKICAIRICVGHNRYLWQSYMSILEDWALSQGCSGMEAIARKGWSKILKDWNTSHYFIEKDFPNGRLIKTTNDNTKY